MRYRVKDYTVQPVAGGVWLYFTAPEGVQLSSDPDNEIEPFIQEAIRLVIDESDGIVLCSSMQKRVYLDRAKCTPATRQIRLLFALPEGESVSSVSTFTIEMDWGDEPTGLSGGDDAHNLASFFNITEATEYTALTPAEAIAIARDCQYNVMGTDWPIPTWLPTGVTEAQVESAAEGLGIPYHEPTQTA